MYGENFLGMNSTEWVKWASLRKPMLTFLTHSIMCTGYGNMWVFLHVQGMCCCLDWCLFCRSSLKNFLLHALMTFKGNRFRTLLSEIWKIEEKLKKTNAEMKNRTKDVYLTSIESLLYNHIDCMRPYQITHFKMYFQLLCPVFCSEFEIAIQF